MPVVEAYRLDRYDNFGDDDVAGHNIVVEAYRLDRYDNYRLLLLIENLITVVEAYRLDRYDNFSGKCGTSQARSCRSLSFG